MRGPVLAEGPKAGRLAAGGDAAVSPASTVTLLSERKSS